MPLAGVAVTSGTARAVTGADGTFELRGIGPTYDVTVDGPGGVTLFQGLTRRDPTLHLDYEGEVTHRDCSGHISGFSAASDSTAGGVVAFVTPDLSVGRSFTSNLGAAFSCDAWIASGISTTGTIRGLLWTKGNGALPTSFYYGSMPFDVEDADASVPGPALAVTQVGSRALNVSANSLPGMTDPVFGVTARFPGEPEWALFDTTAAGAVSSLDVPELATAVTVIGASESDVTPSWNTRQVVRVLAIPSLADAVSFAMPEPVTILEPPPYSQTPYSGARFSWTASDSTIYDLALTVFDDAGQATFVHIITASTAVRAIDVPFPEVALKYPMTFSVMAFGPATSVDEACAPTALSEIGEAGQMDYVQTVAQGQRWQAALSGDQ